MSAAKLRSIRTTIRDDEIDMQDASMDIWDKKYRLKDKYMDPIDHDIAATYRRVAIALAQVEDKDFVIHSGNFSKA